MMRVARRTAPGALDEWARLLVDQRVDDQEPRRVVVESGSSDLRIRRSANHAALVRAAAVCCALAFVVGCGRSAVGLDLDADRASGLAARTGSATSTAGRGQLGSAGRAGSSTSAAGSGAAPDSGVPGRGPTGSGRPDASEPELPRPDAGAVPASDAGSPEDSEPCPGGEVAGTVTVRSAQDIARLKGCRIIRGDLMIVTDELTSLRGLEALREVQGRLQIGPSVMQDDAVMLPLGSPGRLDSLTGLEGLETVQGLELIGLAVSDLKPLANLRDAGHLLLIALDQLVDLAGLERAAWSALLLVDNTALRSLSGLTAAGSIDTLGLADCPQLSDLSALRAVTSVTMLALLRLPSVTTLAGFAGLSSVEQGFAVIDCDALTDLTGLSPALHLGNLTLEGNQSLRTLAGLTLRDPLTFARLTDNARLTSLAGLLPPGASSIEELMLMELPMLTSLAGLETLTSVGALGIYRCDGLGSLTGLTALQRANLFLVGECPSLPSLAGLDALEQVSDTLQLWLMPALTTLQGAPKLTTINLLQLAATGLPTLEGLTALTQVEALEVSDSAALTSLRGLDSLRSLGRLAVFRNPALTSLVGLEGVATITTSADIYDNATLTSLHGLSALTSTSALSVRGNPALPQCEVDWLATRVGLSAIGGDNGPAGGCPP